MGLKVSRFKVFPEKKKSADTDWLCFPVYYNPEDLSKYELMLVEQTSSHIFEGTGANYMSIICDAKNVSFQYNSCRDWFMDTFFNRVNQTLSGSRLDFLEMDELLGIVLALASTGMTNKKNKILGLLDIARSHCHKLVSLCDYAMFGEAIFYSLEHVLKNDYCQETHMAWVKVYSWVLKVIIPIVSRSERRLFDSGISDTNSTEVSSTYSSNRGSHRDKWVS